MQVRAAYSPPIRLCCRKADATLLDVPVSATSLNIERIS
jgi:hypothetical protein